ncbi:MAG: peptide ABC transporter permease [Acidobacteria bacterium]|nr:MAG: peptide ABC transporter permease [Acidobacteriota bacterium]
MTPSRALVANRSVRLGLALLLPLLLGAILSPLLSGAFPHHFAATDLAHRYEPPGKEHLFGTDSLGRDVFARMLRAARASMAVGLLSTALAGAIALCAGSLAGYYGGATDFTLSRLIEIVLSFPTLFIILALLGADPPLLRHVSDLARITLVVGMIGWTGMARHLRAEFLKWRGMDFVQAARAAGASDLRIILRHILPNSLAPLLVSAAFFVAQAILLEAAISFLGFGIQPPEPSWGSMLAEAEEAVAEGWWLALFPGGALFLSVLGCNLIGEGLRQALDPRGFEPGP